MRLSKTQKFLLIVLIWILAGLIFLAGMISGMMLGSVEQSSDSSSSAKKASASNPSGMIGMMTFLSNAITRPVETASQWLAKKKKSSDEAKKQASDESKQSDPKSGSDKKSDAQTDQSQNASSSDKKKPSTTKFWVETDSYALKSKASEKVKELKTKGYNACIVKLGEPGQELYAVQIGDFETADEAARAADEFKKKEDSIAVVNSMSAAIFEQKKDCKGGESG